MAASVNSSGLSALAVGGVDPLSPLINATALSHLMMASVSSGSSALTVPSSRRLGEVVLAVPPPPSPPSPPDGPGMNWVPIIIVLVLIYLAVMALVLASFYCWRQQQPLSNLSFAVVMFLLSSLLLSDFLLSAILFSAYWGPGTFR